VAVGEGRHLSRHLRNTGDGWRLAILPSIAHKGFLFFPDRITRLSKAWSDEDRGEPIDSSKLQKPKET